MVPNLVLNVGVDPLQHPLAGVLVRQVRVHLCRGRTERRQQAGTASPPLPGQWLSPPTEACGCVRPPKQGRELGLEELNKIQSVRERG